MFIPNKKQGTSEDEKSLVNELKRSQPDEMEVEGEPLKKSRLEREDCFSECDREIGLEGAWDWNSKHRSSSASETESCIINAIAQGYEYIMQLWHLGMSLAEEKHLDSLLCEVVKTVKKERNVSFLFLHNETFMYNQEFFFSKKNLIVNVMERYTNLISRELSLGDGAEKQRIDVEVKNF